jgi:hypothetical protein
MRFSPSVIIFCRPSQHNFLVEIKRNQAVRGMIAFRRFWAGAPEWRVGTLKVNL